MSTTLRGQRQQRPLSVSPSSFSRKFIQTLSSRYMLKKNEAKVTREEEEKKREGKGGRERE